MDQGYIIDEIKILKELSGFIVPLGKEEITQLEKNIFEEGCRDPLTLWQTNGSYILVDGHNRYSICQKLDIKFKVEVKEFVNIEDVKEWMINNQLGRRNLTQDQISYYRGLKYERLKKKKGGFAIVESKGQNELSTSFKLANEFLVSESTIKRDAKFAIGLELIGMSNPVLKNKILTGEVKVKKNDLRILSLYKEREVLQILNVADLCNKVNMIRAEISNHIFQREKVGTEKNIEKAQNFHKQFDPLFPSKEEKIQRIKANIVSTINTAIRERNHDSIVEIKNLINSLENELFYKHKY